MIKINKKNIFVFLYINPVTIALMILLSGCSSAKIPECINKSAIKSELSWGVLIKGQPEQSFVMKMNGNITKINSNEKKDLKTAEPDSVCSIMRETGSLIIEVQSLNVPADTNHFISYKNPDTEYYFRALWNPNHNNQSNQKFKELYNRLVNLAE